MKLESTLFWGSDSSRLSSRVSGLPSHGWMDNYSIRHEVSPTERTLSPIRWLVVTTKIWLSLLYLCRYNAMLNIMVV